MSCEWWPTCADDATHRIEVINVTAGTADVVYYCPVHATLELEEVATSPALEVAGIRSLESPASRRQ
ncbi:hypothetical protein [Natrinema sp. 1APR25-10V2]|uniref:hypothetical protein n=1 Tax=Natrinema sp. 1APR25-10V2 TaxID=2951081 RepID=UPI002874ADBE|nr:hypothetical protein [Natrinema sp. 1APR25-10V2]MDS0477050.1 hypothetical protein [Natrinema sp. 1APR25-10V2]